MKTYEAMFLLEPTLANDWPAAEGEINRILERAGAKVIGMTNWGERKLCYPIGHRKRGLYALTFFEAAPDKITGVERDVQLSEKAVRVLVLRRDRMTAEQIQKALAAEPPAKVPTRGEEYESRPRFPRAAVEEREPVKAPAEVVAEAEETVAAGEVFEDEFAGGGRFDPDEVADEGAGTGPAAG